LIKDAIKAVLGVGKKTNSEIKITPITVIWFAFLVAFVFLGSISLLLFLTSIIIAV